MKMNEIFAKNKCFRSSCVVPCIVIRLKKCREDHFSVRVCRTRDNHRATKRISGKCLTVNLESTKINTLCHLLTQEIYMFFFSVDFKG